MPIRLLFQRLDDREAALCRAHPDLACDHVPAERLRHEHLGAVLSRAELDHPTRPDRSRLLHYPT